MPKVSCSMSTRKSEQASGCPSLVGSIHPSPKDRFEADRLLREAAECSAWGRPQTQIPKPDAVTSTRYSLHAGVFSSGVVKLDGGLGGGGALSLPGVRGDRSSSGLLEVQPMALFRPAGAALFRGAAWSRLPSVAAFCNGVARGAFRPRCLGLSPSLSRAGLSLPGACGARCLKRRRSGWYWSWGRAEDPETCNVP